jgi:hypothetical protein
VARARGIETGVRRVRAGLGLLLRQGDPRLDAAMTARPALDPLCAAVLAVTAWDGIGAARLERSASQERSVERVALTGTADVPGVPASRLVDEDGPWAAAWPGAVELGATVDGLRVRAEAGGLTELVVPSAWVGRRGWPALWARAHRSSRSRD